MKKITGIIIVVLLFTTTFSLAGTINDEIIPNDPHFEKQWSLHNTGQTGGTPDADIDLPEAWEMETGTDIIIAIPDSGIDFSHPDLQGIIWTNENEIPENGIDDDYNGYVDDVHGWDFVDGDNEPDDLVGHGTLIAGVLAAETNNGVGIAGISQNCKIMPLKIHNSGFARTSQNTALAIEYAADNGADIISMSIGRYSNNQIEENAIQYAYEKGCIQVCAVGNDDMDQPEDYPPAYEYVIAVAGTNENDERCDSDDWGEPYGSNYGEIIDVAAPANDIFSTMPTYHVLFNNNPWNLDKNYDMLDGNSLASPHVAGIIALLLSRNPTLTQEEVTNVIKESADPYQSDNYIGTGRVNAHMALLSANTPPSIPELNGPNEGESGVEYTYYATSSDIEGDQIFYAFDWGIEDQIIVWQGGPYDSEETVDSSVIWSEEGTYEVRVKAKDIYDQESDWSDPIEITMPKTKISIDPFLRFLENHPRLFPILRLLLT